MKIEEVRQMMALVATYQPNVATEESADSVATAWFMALDVRLTLERAQEIVVGLAAAGEWITPGALNEVHLAAIREAHQQGRPKPRLPLTASQEVTRRDPVQIGASRAVKPQDVPEYVAARSGRWGGDEPPTYPAWSVECPHCRAKPGDPCVVVNGTERRRLRHRASHPSREEAVAGS